MPPLPATNNPPPIRKRPMSESLSSIVARYRSSILEVEAIRDTLAEFNQVDTSQLQKCHISGAMTHLEGWLVIQRFRLKAALDVMRSPQAPYTHIGVDPGAAQGDSEVTHSMAKPSDA